MTPAAKTANEALLHVGVRHQISLAQYGNKVVTDVLSLLNAADKELAAKLSVRLEAGKDNWTSRRLQALIREISQINAENYGAAAKLLKTEMVGLAETEARVAAKGLSTNLPSLSVTEEQLETALKKLGQLSPSTRKATLAHEFWIEPPKFSNDFLDVKKELFKSINEWRALGVEGEVTQIPLAGLHTTQDWADKNRISQMMEAWQTKGQPALARGDRPEIFGYQGNLYIADGNHRAIAADLLKLDNIESQYVNLTPDIPIRSNTVPGKAVDFEGNVVFSVIQPTAEQLAAIVSTEAITLGPDGAELLDDIFKTLAAGKEARIRQAIRMGMAEGESVPDLVKRLIGSRAAQFTDGIIERDRRAAEAICRTAVNHVSNKAADMTYRQNSDLISGCQWVLTLDSRTCPVCVRNAQGGKPYKMDEGPRPPVHVNDRCFMVPVMKSWRELGLDIDEMPISGRAASTGVEAGDMTYSQWLTKYPEHAVEALGPARAKLFQEGKIKVENFVNDRGKLLTLEQLKEK